MKKRILAVLLSVLTVVTIFAGCGTGQETLGSEQGSETSGTEDEETKDKEKNLSDEQIENDVQVLSSIAAAAMEVWVQGYSADIAMIINLGTVHETGKETTATGVEDEFLGYFWELFGHQNFEEIKEMMYSDITNIEIVFSLAPDSYPLALQAYNSDGPCFEPIVLR